MSGEGTLYVVSAPSGTGKTSLVEQLVRRLPNLVRSRSYTSRARRHGEADGVDYNFVSRETFERMIARDEFLEWADVFGNLYGTARADVEARLSAGDDVVLVIDVSGARQVRARRAPATSIFVMPPSPEVLEARLRGRSRDSEEQIERRLAVARNEVKAHAEYDHVVVNDDFEAAVGRLGAIVAGRAVASATTQAAAIAAEFDET
ncbi:MAG: guanylate kinase [Vicinamibacterales bacterium]|jgi:guanylate kinase|nr:guanylate kinase [Acidobacteriota bacterium]MDP6373058.1 guanylate kinase [Vicinamibacterales bacterium]MDP6610112.1 guanylate kinase [Vicinamibacterales bacterium]HAK55326.1 guanylate kinase [Acidobacteriota bacterium]|tara:strand:+ start:2828 stop:3442 length:615 start_codon:yes stop_codon:yes gene_type:complete